MVNEVRLATVSHVVREAQALASPGARPVERVVREIGLLGLVALTTWAAATQWVTFDWTPEDETETRRVIWDRATEASSTIIATRLPTTWAVAMSSSSGSPGCRPTLGLRQRSGDTQSDEFWPERASRGCDGVERAGPDRLA